MTVQIRTLLPLAALLFAPLVPAGASDRADPPARAGDARDARNDADGQGADNGLKPFRATYRVSYGVLSGELTLELEHRMGDDWMLTSTATTRGVARVFRRGELVERTLLRADENGIRPMEYNRTDGISGPERNASLMFMHEEDRVVGSDREDEVDLSMNGELSDRLSMQVRLMFDLLNGERPESYQVIDRAEIRKLSITYAGDEQVRAAGSDYDSLRIEHQSENSSRSTRLWLAREERFLPVRIEQLRRGSTEWTGELREVTWGEAPSQAAASARR